MWNPKQMNLQKQQEKQWLTGAFGNGGGGGIGEVRCLSKDTKFQLDRKNKFKGYIIHMVTIVITAYCILHNH